MAQNFFQTLKKRSLRTYQVLGALLAGSAMGLTLTSTAAGTLQGSPLQGPFIQRTFIMEVWYDEFEDGDTNFGCMILANNGNDLIPSALKWPGGGSYCGLSAPVAQMQWDIYPIVYNGVVQHVIRNHYNGNCLIHGSSGNDRYASVYRWSQHPDDLRWCGLGSASELGAAGGFATWDFSEMKSYKDQRGDLVYAGAINQKTANYTAQLVFSPYPDNGEIPHPVFEKDEAFKKGYFILYSSLVQPAPVPVSVR
jgi:hypothetical protein